MLQQQRNAAGILDECCWKLLDECCHWGNAAGLLPSVAGPLGQGRWNQDPLSWTETGTLSVPVMRGKIDC